MNEKYLIPKKDLTIYFIISIFYMTVIIILFGNPFTDESWYIYFEIIALLYVPEILAIIFNSIVRSSIIKKELIIQVMKILFNIFTVIWYAFSGFYVYFCYGLSGEW